MRLATHLLVVAALLAGCRASNAECVDAVTKYIDDGAASCRLEHCDLLRGARIVSSAVEDHCGNTCKHLTARLAGPAGRSEGVLEVSPGDLGLTVRALAVNPLR